MSGPSRSSPEPISDIRQLAADLERGCKPRAAWRIGTEHEKFAYDLDTLAPLPYHGEKSILAMLTGLMQFGWEPVMEGDTIIALHQDGQSVSLEPGGQFELSGAPLATLHDTCKEVNDHLHQVKAVDAELGTGVFGLGFQPKWTRAEIPVMPKGRYGIMSAYMPKKGDLGLDMMFRTCTIQVNLDFESEADMVEKFRIAQALQPVATALFANSPFTEGKPNGFLSYRSHIWTDTDPDRCGLLPFVHEAGMGFERYVQHVLDVPMYFVYRDGRYIDASGQSFRDFIDGRLPALPGERPTMGDWHDHLTTLFPEVRLKHYMEMRGADGGPWMRICALPALWVGLLYDKGAQDSAWQLVKDWPIAEIERLRAEVPKAGLRAAIDGRSLREVARDVLSIADAGLRRRARRNPSDDDESGFLDPLHAIVETGRTPAEDLLARYEKHWHGSVDPIFTELAY